MGENHNCSNYGGEDGCTRCMKALRVEVNLLRDAIDKSNVALAEAVGLTESLQRMTAIAEARQDEIETLKDFDTGRSECLRLVIAEREALKLQKEALWKWVDDYARHDTECAAHSNQRKTSAEGPCDCGLAALFATHRVKQKCDHADCGVKKNPFLECYCDRIPGVCGNCKP